MNLLRLNDAFNKRYCIFYTLNMNHGLHCLQLSNIKLVKSGNWKNQISYKRTATNDLPLKEIDAIVLFLLFLYIVYTIYIIYLRIVMYILSSMLLRNTFIFTFILYMIHVEKFHTVSK